MFKLFHRISYSIDTYQFPRRLSTVSHGHQCHSHKLTRVESDGRSAPPQNQSPSHAYKPHVNNDLLLQAASPVVSAEPIFRSQPGCDKTNSYPMPVDLLREILSPRFAGNDQSYNIDELVSLVASVQAEGQLSKLKPNDMSAIISLFGTLSIYPATTQIYDNPLASCITTQSPRTYWSLIAQIAHEKVRLSRGLTPSDHYWLMRVELAIVNHPDREQLLECKQSS